MRFLFRTLAALVSAFLIILVATGLIRFVQHNWFKGGLNPASVGVLDVSGPIWSSTSFLKHLERATENPSIKALVIRVNSPGGLVAPSQEIFEGLKKADTKVPVIVSMGALAASGGYYVALGGRQVFANPGTLTGSIGVIMEFVNTEKLYQWAKVERYTLKAGKFKDIGSPMRNMTPEEKALMATMLQDIHTQFRAAVKDRRKIEDDKKIEELTQGQIFTGAQAKQFNLVDTLGGFQDALAAARTAAKLDEKAPVEYIGQSGGMLRRFLMGEDDEGGESESYLSRVLALFERHPRLTPGWSVLLLAPLS